MTRRAYRSTNRSAKTKRRGTRSKKRSSGILSKLFSLPMLAVALVLTFVTVRATIDIAGKYSRASAAAAEARTEYQEIVERKEELERQLERLETDVGKEAEIRSKLNVAREGERVIQLLDSPEGEVEETEKTKEWGIWTWVRQTYGW